jgi:hypothetical protein
MEKHLQYGTAPVTPYRMIQNMIGVYETCKTVGIQGKYF